MYGEHEVVVEVGGRAPSLQGPVFEPLRDPAYFQSFSLDPQFHTLVWPNGVDLSPEFLHDNVHVVA